MSEFDHFVGTRPVTGQQAFYTDALCAWLEAKLPGFKGPLFLVNPRLFRCRL